MINMTSFMINFNYYQLEYKKIQHLYQRSQIKMAISLAVQDMKKKIYQIKVKTIQKMVKIQRFLAITKI